MNSFLDPRVQDPVIDVPSECKVFSGKRSSPLKVTKRKNFDE